MFETMRTLNGDIMKGAESTSCYNAICTIVYNCFHIVSKCREFRACLSCRYIQHVLNA